MTRFILVRHGKTEWNRNERFRDRAEIPLNETGLAQAEATGKRVALNGNQLSSTPSHSHAQLKPSRR